LGIGQIQSTSSPSISLKWFSILSSHLYLSLPNYFFHWSFPPKFCIYSHCSGACYICCLSHLSSCPHHNDICWIAKIMTIHFPNYSATGYGSDGNIIYTANNRVAVFWKRKGIWDSENSFTHRHTVPRLEIYSKTAHKFTYWQQCLHDPSLWVTLLLVGRAIALASHRGGQVRAQVRSCGIYGGKSGIGEGFLRILRFLLPILLPSTAPYSSSIIRGWYNRPVSGRHSKWTQSHSALRNYKKNYPPARMPALLLQSDRKGRDCLQCI
jgi:hypothetical protein